MKPLNKNERRLVAVLGLVVFVMGNLWGQQFLKQKQSAFKSQLADLKVEDQESKQWLADQTLWIGRKQWLDEHQPKATTQGEINSALLEFLQSSARKQNITITEQSLTETPPQSFSQQATVNLKIGGSLESILKWLAEVQQPDKFQAVPSFKLLCDTEPPKMKCEMQVARFYAP
jgi:hypothetical protein